MGFYFGTECCRLHNNICIIYMYYFCNEYLLHNFFYGKSDIIVIKEQGTVSLTFP